MSLPIAHSWYVARPVDPVTTVLSEPHVDPLVQANMWHVRGRDRDLLVDSGLGISPLRSARPELFARDPLLVLTHAHLDHMGGAHEFTEVCAHPTEQVSQPAPGSLRGPTLAAQLGLDPNETTSELLIDALPHPGYDPDSYRLRPALVTRDLTEGHLVDIGDRTLTTLHLPGHSPGSIALFDEHSGTLFSGDVIYDGKLLDTLTGSNINDYVMTMARLRELDARTIHPGHGASFTTQRLHQLIDTYIHQADH